MPGYLEQIPFTGMISACGATIEKDGQSGCITMRCRWKWRNFPWRLCVNTVWSRLWKVQISCTMTRTSIRLKINWYRDLITEALGPKWRPIRGYEDSYAYQQDQCQDDSGLQ